MKKILAFSGSNSSTSINQTLVEAATTLISNDVDVIRLDSFSLPMYSIDSEKKDGFSSELARLRDTIKAYDAFIIAVPEHNGFMPAFFKNAADWLSRIEKKVFEGKPVVLLSTSNGRKGAAQSREFSAKLLGYLGADVVAQWSLPQFSENLDRENGIIWKNETPKQELKELLKVLEK